MYSSFNIIFSKPVKNFQMVLQPFYCFFSLFFFFFLMKKNTGSKGSAGSAGFGGSLV